MHLRDQAQLVVALGLLGRAVLKRMGNNASSHEGNGMDLMVCAPSLVTCACGSSSMDTELEEQQDYTTPEPTARGGSREDVLDVADCVPPVSERAFVEATRSTAPPAPAPAEAWTGPVAESVADSVGGTPTAALDLMEKQRAARAAEVAESERVFLREYRAMMRGGLELVVRLSTQQMRAQGVVESCIVAFLALAEERTVPAVEWTYATGATESLKLRDVIAVNACPLQAELGHELSARSFMLIDRKNAMLFHAPSEDIAGLCVDGLQMLVDRERKRTKKAKSLKAAKATRPRAVLGDSNVIAA